MSERISSNPYRFRCLRPDHTNVFDEHALASDYDGLKIERDALKAALERSLKVQDKMHEYWGRTMPTPDWEEVCTSYDDAHLVLNRIANSADGSPTT